MFSLLDNFSFGFCGGRWFHRRNGSFRWRRIQAVLQQLRHVALDSFELVQMQIRVGDGENVTRPRLLVNEHALAVADNLLLHLEDALAFEHHGEDERGGRVARVVLLDELAQQRLGGLLLDGVHRRQRHLKNALPVRDESFALARAVAELILPAGFANVHAAQIFRVLVKEQRVQRLLVGKRPGARLARRCAGLDVPLVHGRGDLTTNGLGAASRNPNPPRSRPRPRNRIGPAEDEDEDEDEKATILRV
jgi:hypothetical protein